MPIRLVVFEPSLPGVAAAAHFLRSRGIKVGTTGDGVAEPGFEPDATVRDADVPPGPWRIFRVMEQTGVYPPKAVLTVGDTPAAVAESQAAGAWVLGVVDGGREMGLTAAAFAALSEDGREQRRVAVRDVLLDAGADAVIDSLAELPEAIAALEAMA